MTRNSKLLLGALTAWPIVYIPLFVIFVFAQMTTMQTGASADMGFFPVLMGLHMATILIGLGTMVYYCIHAIRDARIPMEHRLIWVVVMFAVGFLAAPVYWYMRIWKDIDLPFGKNELRSAS